MSKKILVAVSANSSDFVLTTAIEFAQKCEAGLLALHIVYPRSCYLGPGDYSYGPIVEAMEAYGQRKMAQIKDALGDSTCGTEARMVTLPVTGLTIGEAIASLAETSEADLIVLGERRPTWWRCLSENVFDEVRRHTDQPIHVVSSNISRHSARRPNPRWTDAPAAGTR
jgi:nucleotide-binding universal stress UspA family protein